MFKRTVPVCVSGGVFCSLPIAEAIQHVVNCAAALSASAERAPEGQGFAEELVQAVRRNIAARNNRRVIAESAPEEGSFAEELKKAVEEKSGRKRHQEWVERERERYAKHRRRAVGE